MRSLRGDATRLIIFVIICSLTFVLLYLTLGRTQIGPTNSYSAVMTDASGLEKGDLVRVAGVRVGQVDDLSFGEDNQVTVRFQLNEEQGITSMTEAAVRYENLLGDRYLQLRQASREGEPLPVGGTIPVERTTPALSLDVLLNGFRPLFRGLEPQEVNQLATNLISTLQGQGGTIRSLLEQTSSFTNGLADDDKVIGSLITNLDTLLESLDSRDQQLRTSITQFKNLVSGLSEDRDPIAASITSIAELSDRLADLFVDVREPFKETTIAVKDLAVLLNTNEKTLNKVLGQLPEAYRRITRVASHGNFFNFYLCSAQVKISGPGGKPITTPVVKSQTKRCTA